MYWKQQETYSGILTLSYFSFQFNCVRGNVKIPLKVESLNFNKEKKILVCLCSIDCKTQKGCRGNFSDQDNFSLSRRALSSLWMREGTIPLKCQLLSHINLPQSSKRHFLLYQHRAKAEVSGLISVSHCLYLRTMLSTNSTLLSWLCCLCFLYLIVLKQR